MARFVGLDGAQGAGKTTYATKLISEYESQTGLPVAYIETDDFLVEREQREHLRESFFVPANLRKLWDFERLGQVLRQMQMMGSGVLKIDGLYNRMTGKRDAAKVWEVRDKGVVLVGGPYLLEPELNNLFEKLIFLDVPLGERKRRVMGRWTGAGRSQEEIAVRFDKFERFAGPYWEKRMDRYDEVIPN